MSQAALANYKVLLVAPSGLLRNSLQAYLRAFPEIQVIGQLDSTSEILKTLSLLKPDAVVMDCAFFCDPFVSSLRRLLEEGWNINFIVLVDTVSQQQLALQRGAKFALLKGLLDDGLKNAIITTKLSDSQSYVIP